MTLDIQNVLQSWRDNIMNSLRVSMPGYITKYDPERKEADVQLTIKFEENGEYIDPPLLRNVPVRQYNTPSVCFYAPPEIGALVDVIFTDSSLAEHQENDGQQLIEPQEINPHTLSNCYAVLQVQTLKNQHEINDPTLPGIYLEETTKLFLGRQDGGQEEVLNLMHQTANAMNDLLTYLTTQITFSHSPGNPSGPPTNGVLLQPVQQKVVTILAGLQSLGEIEEI